MSGLLNSHRPCWRAQSRSASGVSPSYGAARTSGRSSAASARSWSAASALVGERYRAVARRSAAKAASTGSW